MAFLYGAILLLGVTMTLPGFAGMILTIGVAADSNVVIFERIKEEVRAGKSVRAAIAAGYAKGFHTIVDANVVTGITALVLFGVATAGVKGFALMLLVGTVLSLVTAVAATRAMLGLLAGFKWFANPRFMGAQGQQGAKWLQIDFMRRRNTWFAISGVVMLDQLRLAHRPRAEPRDRLQERHADRVQDDEAAHGRGRARRSRAVQLQGRADPGDREGEGTRRTTYREFQIRTEALGVKQVGARGTVNDPRQQQLTTSSRRRWTRAGRR